MHLTPQIKEVISNRVFFSLFEFKCALLHAWWDPSPLVNLYRRCLSDSDSWPLDLNFMVLTRPIFNLGGSDPVLIRAVEWLKYHLIYKKYRGYCIITACRFIFHLPSREILWFLKLIKNWTNSLFWTFDLLIKQLLTTMLLNRTKKIHRHNHIQEFWE